MSCIALSGGIFRPGRGSGEAGLVAAPRMQEETGNPFSEAAMRASTCPCIFCELIQGGGEISICYEDSQALAFMDIQPVNAGHVLVVPVQHYESLVDMPADLIRHLFDVATRLAPIVRRLSGADGLNIIVNSGAAAGQDVFHYHVHVIPRRTGDGFAVTLPFPGSSPPDRTLLDAMAARIIAEFRDPARKTTVAA